MLKAIIVDDEVQARSVLKQETKNNCPDVMIVAEAGNVADAIDAIELYRPDLLFLDIQLTDGMGFDILEHVGNKNMKVIFTTAYSQYALKAIKFSALDYLLKPIDGEELKTAVDKIKLVKDDEYKTNFDNFIANNALAGNKKKIALHTSKGIMLTAIEDIILCQSESNYTRIIFVSGPPLVISKTLKDFDDMLSNNGFERIHASYLINMQHMTQYNNRDGGSVTMVNNMEIPVARRKKASLLKMLDELNNM